MTNSGRVEAMTEDRKGGVVRDSDGTEYPFTVPAERELKGEMVLFKVETKTGGGEDALIPVATIIS